MKFEKNNFHQVKTDFIDLESWLKIRKKKSEQKCPNCGRMYNDIGDKVAMMTFKDRKNTHICNSCGRKYIELGAIDINKKDEHRESLKVEIEKYKKIDTSEKSNEELEILLSDLKQGHEKQKRIEESVVKEDEWDEDEYLFTQYDIFRNKKYLNTPLAIEDFFYEEGYNFFDCGQGYYEEEANLLVQIGREYFEVVIVAEITSQKQDIGDRLYWVDRIKSVEYIKVDKPKEKSKKEYNFNLTLTEDDKKRLDDFIKTIDKG